MRNIYKFLVLILVVSFASCKDSDEQSDDVLSVIESDISFFASGGNDGYIKVNLTDGYTATSDKDWCTLTIDNDIIKISASPNSGLGSRAALVKITYGNQKEEVAVFQHGVILTAEKTDLSFKLSNGPESPQTVKINATITPTVTVADNWVTATMVGDTLIVYCNSTSTEERTTTVTVTAGENSIVITVTQRIIIFYEDYLGEWTLTGIDIFTGEEITYPDIVITQNVYNESYYVEGWWSWDAFAGMKFEMLFDKTTFEVSIVGLQDAGEYMGYAVYFMTVIDADGFLDYHYGIDPGLKGKLIVDKITWEYQDVYDLYYEDTFQSLGVSFMFPELYYWDDYILYNAVLTKK
jgi:hypothetical protein